MPSKLGNSEVFYELGFGSRSHRMGTRIHRTDQSVPRCLPGYSRTHRQAADHPRLRVVDHRIVRNADGLRSNAQHLVLRHRASAH